MALLCQAGTFIKDDSGVDDTAQDVALPFDPKALIIWGEHLATGNTDVKQDHHLSIGFVDDANNQYCINPISEDGVARADCDTFVRSSKAITFISFGAVIQADAVVTLGIGKFTATWGWNDTVASKIHYIAYGGDDIEGTQVGSITAPTSAGNQSYILDADVQSISDGRGVVFFLGGSLPDWDQLYLSETVGLGVATGTASGAQGGIFATELNNEDPSTPRDQWREDACVIAHNVASGSVRMKAVFNGFDSQGFDLDWITTIGDVQKLAYLIIKGGQWQAGTGTAKTTTGLKTETTNFIPKGLFTFGMARTTEGISAENVSFQIGAADGVNEASGGFTEESNVGNPNLGTMSSITKTLRVMSAADQSVLAEANLDSFNDFDFTLDYTTIDGNAYKYTWVVCSNNINLVPAGIEWTLKQSIPSASRVAAIAKITSRIFLLITGSVVDQIWRSTDRGETWSLVKDLGPSSSAIYSVEGITNNGRNSICLVGAHNSPDIWRSTDAGLTWANIHTGTNRILAIERITNSLVLASETSVLIRSTNAGQDWSTIRDFGDEVPSQSGVKTICRVTDSICLLGTQGEAQIWRSINGGVDWTKVKELWLEDPTQDQILDIVALTDTVILAASTDFPITQIWRSDDAGLTWSLAKHFTAPTEIVRSIVRISDTEAYAGSDDEAMIYRSTDAGLTWLLQDSLALHPENVTWIYDLEFANEQSVLLGASDGQIWKSINSNVTTTSTTTTTTTVPLSFEAPATQGSGVQPGVISEGFGGFGFGWG